jgi:hypothetical protein
MRTGVRSENGTQSRGRSKRKPDSDVRQQQERRYCPELVGGKDKGEQPAGSFPQLAEIESDCREQIEAQRYSHRAGSSTALSMAKAPQAGRNSPATWSTSCK